MNETGGPGRPSQATLMRLIEGDRNVLALIASGAPLEDVLALLAQTAVDLCGSSATALIMLAEDDGSALFCAEGTGIPEAFRRAVDGLPVREGAMACGTAAARREPVSTPDIGSDPLWDGYREAALAAGLRSALSVPILGSGEAVLGTLAIYHGAPQGCRTAEQDALTVIARTAAIAIERNRAQRLIAAGRRRDGFLFELGEELRAQTGPDRIAAIASRRIGTFLGAEHAGYAEISADGRRATVADAWSAGAAEAMSGAYDLTPFGEEVMQQARSGHVFRIDAPAAGEPDPLLERLRFAAPEAAGAAILIAPVIKRGRLAAALFVLAAPPRHWTDAETDLVSEIGERVWATLERTRAEAALRESEDHYRHAVELNPQVAWTSSPDGLLDQVSGRWRDWTGTSGLGASWGDAVHPGDLEATRGAWERARQSEAPYDIEHRIRLRSGSYHWMRSRAFPRRNASGQVVKWYGTTEDIHERRLAVEQMRLLVNELNHRVKNTLAMVQAIAGQTFRHTRDPEAAQAAFNARLMALARAHDLLTEQAWEGASIGEVVGRATAPYDEGGRIRSDGPDVWLSPKAALNLALMLHELATNAVRFGALSRPGGTVSIQWQFLEDGRLRIEWRELGGPEVAPPQRRGFGSRLIENALAAELDGETKISYGREGVTCTITLTVPNAR